MIESLTSLPAYLRKFIGNRRGTNRYKISLPLRISIVDPLTRAPVDHALSSLEGRTMDISLKGLSLVVPSIRIGEEYLTHQLRVLIVEVELPDGTIQMETAAVRYRTLDQKDVEKGHLIGVRITAMNEEHRARYENYLLSLG